MNSRKYDHNQTDARSGAERPRFTIEKLEERIAPRKGGIPGSPDGDDVGGKERAGCRGSGCDR